MQVSDRDTVDLIRENPYIQFFLGCPDYQYDLALDASLLTHVRKRFPADVIAQVNQWIVDAGRHSEDDGNDDDAGSSDSKEDTDHGDVEADKHGTLILDATCAPQAIQYPTDIRLLHVKHAYSWNR